MSAALEEQANQANQANYEQIKSWKDTGKTTAILFGRFQPLNKGHIALIKAVLESGLDVHIFIKSDVGTDDGRNPYSVEQRKKMLKKEFPELTDKNLHSVNFHLNEGDKGNNFDNLIKSSQELAYIVKHIKKGVIFYGRKEEDVKDYTIFGTTHKNIHYIDLFKKLGFDTQEVIHDVGHGVGSTDFRNNGNLDIIPDNNVDYIKAQHLLAERNRRPVGANKKNDEPEVDGTTADGVMDLGRWQSEMLKERKRVTVPIEYTKR